MNKYYLQLSAFLQISRYRILFTCLMLLKNCIKFSDNLRKIPERHNQLINTA